MRPGSLRSVLIAAPSVQGKPCKARNGRWTGRPHRESPRASVSASPVIIYYNACLKTQSDRLLEVRDRDGTMRTYLPDGSVSDAPSGPSAEASQMDEVFRYGEPRVGGILIDPENGREPVVPVSVPVFDDRGVAHILTAHLRAWVVNRAL